MFLSFRRTAAMHIGLLLLATGLAVAPADAARKCEASANYGAIIPPTAIQNAVKALPPEALLGKRGKPLKDPDSRVMLESLPPVAQQGTSFDPGSPGTSAAEAYGYGLGTYAAARDVAGDIKWDTTQQQNQASAAYLYALAQKQDGGNCPAGTSSFDHLEQLTRFGAPSRVQINYQPNCTYLDRVNTSPLPNMQRFRIGSYALIPVSGNANAVSLIKSQLQGGLAVAFSGLVLCNYATKPVFKSGVIYDTATVPESGHGQLIVGYDDRMGLSDRRGAFLVQNSFGTSWPPASSGSPAPDGMAWWSYDSFSATQTMAAVAYPVDEDLGKRRLETSTVNVPVATVERAYQWTPGKGSKNVYLILRLIFDAPVKLNEVWLKEPDGTALQVRAVYGQHIRSGYAYLRRSDGKSFLSGSYKLTLKTGGGGETPASYTGKVKVKKLKKAGDLDPASMTGVRITGPTGALVTTSTE